MTYDELKKEYERLKIELRQKIDYIHELWETKEEYKQRAIELWETKEEYKQRAIVAEKRVEELKEQNDDLCHRMNLTLIPGKKELPSDEDVIADIKKAMAYLQYQLEKLEKKENDA